MFLDLASAQTVARPCACLAPIGAWRAVVRLATGLTVTPVPLLRTAGTLAAVFALERGERLHGPSLNRWDDAAARLTLAGAVGLAT